MKEVKKQQIKQQDSRQSRESRQIKAEAQYGPIIPAAKVSPQVIEILRTTKVPQLIIPSHTTIPGAAKIYFEQYLKLFGENRQLNTDLIEIFQQRNKLAQKYNELKRQENQTDGAIRRKRRFASQIKRDFSCPSLNCHKSYGSEGSLTQHVKLKHQNFYKSGQYQILLQNMLDQMAKSTRVKRQEQTRSKKIVKKQQKVQYPPMAKRKKQHIQE